MNHHDITNSIPTKNMSLKRNKNAFHMSTAAISTSQQTIDRNKTPIFEQPTAAQTIPNLKSYKPNKQSQLRQQIPTIVNPNSNIQKLSNTDPYKSLQYLIGVQNQTNKTNDLDRYINNQTNTHSYIYKGISSLQQTHQNYEYCKNKQQNFPPNFVDQIYQKQLRKSPDGKVNYHYGYLQRTGYFYFSIQKTLILYSSKIYENSSDQQQQQPILVQDQQLGHILCIKQIVIQDLDVEDIQRHPFGQKNVVLLFWQPWKINFYAFQPYSLMKLQNLYMRFDVSSQGAFLIDYCSKGNVYYLNQIGELGRITLFHKQITFTNFLNWNWNKKFRIKQYFFKFKHNTARKYQKFSQFYQKSSSFKNPSIFKQIKQFYLDKKYYWSAKKTKGISLICDRQRNLLYTLVQTSLKNSTDTNRQTNQSNRQIRMYNIDQKSSCRDKKNFFNRFYDRLQAQIYSNPPLLLRQLSQQQLYYQIGFRCLNNCSLFKFQISGIYIPSDYKSKQVSYGFLQTNLVIILSNSTRLFVVLSSQRLALNQLINMPNMQQINNYIANKSSDSKSSIPTQQQGIVITQKQQINFRLLHFLYNRQDRSLAIFGVYRRSILGILLTQNISLSQMESKSNQKSTQGILSRRYNSNQEQIVIVLDHTREQDIGSTSIFINVLDFKIFATPELQNNIYKRKIASHKQALKPLNNNQVLKQDQRRRRPQLQQISRQVLHYPRQYLFINKDKIIGITKLRPVDVLLTYLHKQISRKDHNYISTLKLNDNSVLQIYVKMQKKLKSKYRGLPFHQIICMLTQIFCDIDGTYFCQQFAVNRWNRRLNKQKKNQNQTTLQKQRITQATIPFNQINSNFTQNNQQPRFTQKLSIVNKIRKFRHSDLLSSQIFWQNTRMSNTPIKVRSQNSIMILIQRLLIIIVKNQSRIRRQIKKQGIYSQQNLFEKSESPANKKIIQSILLYLSRVLSPIWQSHINNIHLQIFNFIADISKKVYEIFVKLQQERVQTENIGQVIDFATLFLEYNLMLAVIGFRLNLSYADGLGIQKQAFQQAIFNSLQRIKDKVNVSSSVNQWRSKFPSYFSLNLFKALKIQAEISSIGNKKMKKQAVVRNNKHMPHYLLYFYCKEGILSRRQIKELLQSQQTQIKQEIKLKNINNLIITDGVDLNQKVEYATKQILKTSRSLDQKQLLVLYALQKISSIRTFSVSQSQAKIRQLRKIQNILKIQKLILQQIKKYGSEISENTKNLLNYHILKPKQLKALVNQLKNPFISLICMCTLWDYQLDNTNVQKVLRDLMFDGKGKLISSVKYREKIESLFRAFPNSINKLPLVPFLVVLNQLAFNQIQLDDFTIVIHRNEPDKIQKNFWVPLFLSEWNWSQPSILDYYIQQCRQSFRPLPFQTQRRFIYNWVSGYTLVKFRYKEGRKIFQVFNEILLNLGNNQSIDARILGSFMRQNLGY